MSAVVRRRRARATRSSGRTRWIRAKGDSLFRRDADLEVNSAFRFGAQQGADLRAAGGLKRSLIIDLSPWGLLSWMASRFRAKGHQKNRGTAKAGHAAAHRHPTLLKHTVAATSASRYREDRKAYGFTSGGPAFRLNDSGFAVRRFFHVCTFGSTTRRTFR